MNTVYVITRQTPDNDVEYLQRIGPRRGLWMGDVRAATPFLTREEAEFVASKVFGCHKFSIHTDQREDHS